MEKLVKCQLCHATYERESFLCHACNVVDNLYGLFSPILLTMQVLYIGPSILTLDNKTRSLLFSSRQELKHKRINNRLIHYSNLKQSYILIAAAIEEHFNNLKSQQASCKMNLNHCKSPGAFCNKYHDQYFFNCIKERKSLRFSNTISFVWNAQNVFKHCNGRLNDEGQSCKTLQEKYFKKYERYFHTGSVDLDILLFGNLFKKISDEPHDIDPRNLPDILCAAYIYCLDTTKEIFGIRIPKVDIGSAREVLCEADYKDDFKKYLDKNAEFFY